MKPLTKTFHFCPMCGAPYQPDQITKLHKQCQNCGYTVYENLRTSVGALIVKDNHILLVKRAIQPRQGTWDVPGGFTEPYEHPEQTMAREIQEELGVDCRVIHLFGVYAPNPYMYLGKMNYACDLFYLVELLSDQFHPADDVSAYHWFPLSELPPTNKLAFPTTVKALTDYSRYALDRVRKPKRG